MSGNTPESMRNGRKAVQAHTDTPAGGVCIARDSHSQEVLGVFGDSVPVSGSSGT